MVNMSKYSMNEEDYKILNSIIQVTNSIDTLYKKLLELEISNLKETKEYEMYIQYLNMSIELENSYYDKLTIMQGIKILNFLMYDKFPENDLSDIESIITRKKDDPIIRRILVVLDSILENYHQDTVEQNFKILEQDIIFDDEELDDLPESFIYDYYCLTDELYTKLLRSKYVVDNSHQEEILKNFIVFIEEIKQDKDNSKYLNELIKVKYDIAFNNKDVEYTLVDNKFNVDTSITYSSNYSLDILGIEEEIYTLLKDYSGVKLSVNQINELLTIKDLDYELENNQLTALLRHTILRSIFLSLSDDCVSHINKQYLEDNLNNEQVEISKEMLLKTFVKVKKDRIKHSKLSLRK